MAERVVVAGSTGKLGMRLVKELRAHGAEVVALVRAGVKAEKTDGLKALGAQVTEIDPADVQQIARACTGAGCVVSTLAGLREVIVDTQQVLLKGAIQAGVARFIPSDFSTDFRPLVPGENRNFDLRREFHKTLDVAPIQATAVFNGAFAEILRYNIPILDMKKKTVGFWGDADHKMDFTTMDDTAAYTAAAALGSTTPQALRIASFQVSANDLVRFTEEKFGRAFALVSMGSIEGLRAYNKSERAAHPEGEQELYSQWQQGQYMQSMFSTGHEALDNGRYPKLTWTTLTDFLRGAQG